MPTYVYKCYHCDEEYLDYQSKYIGSRDIYCPRLHVFSGDAIKVLMYRDYQAEKAAVISDWEPGYNVGIDERYTSKADLLSKIRRKGLYPSIHGGGVSVGGSKPGLYGDEEYRHIMKPSEPEHVEGLTNEAPLIP